MNKTGIILKTGGIIILLVKVLLSSPLDGNFNYLGQGLLLFSNPSLIVSQKGYPTEVQLFFPSSEQDLEGKVASIFSFPKNAFSIGYAKTNDVFNRFSAAYSLKQQFFLFGSTFSILTEKDIPPSLAVDVAVAFNILKNRYISVSYTNLIITDTILKSLNPQITISFNGPLPKIGDYLGLDFSSYVEFYDYKTLDVRYGGTLKVVGKFFIAPIFHYLLGTDIKQNETKKIDIIPQAGFGMEIKISEASSGLFFGYQYDINNNEYGMMAKIYFNPILNRDRTPLTVQIKSSCGTDKNEGIFVSVLFSEKKEISEIKNWTLIFSTLPSKEGKILKTFSGGNIPPSTVYWDLRDNNGDVHDDHEIFIRLLISDKNNNLTATPWDKIIPYISK
jgi:hypothetical protein